MRKIIFSLLLLMFSIKSFAQHEMLNLRIGYNKLQYIAAGNSVNNLQQAEAYLDAGKYLYSQHSGLNLGIAKDNYWVTFKVIIPSTSEKGFIINQVNCRIEALRKTGLI